MSDADKCGCCEGVGSLPPCTHDNPPGQASLRYRVGTHGRFLESMLAGLARQPALKALTTRSSDDPALALVDAWAALLDVLGFYQERIAQEGFLRTSTERRSVLELARAIGYELRPGVAASTFLAFNLESAPGAPPVARIAAGTKTQSIPAQDQKPQVFETLEEIQARSAWNALEVRHQEPFLPYWGATTIFLRGQNTRLQNGDTLLIVGDERRKDPGSEKWDFRRVERVMTVPPAEASADPLSGCTVVTLDKPLGSFTPSIEPAKLNPRCFALRTRASLFGQGAPDWKAMPRSLRAGYRGFDDETRALFSLNPEWPGYTLADVSDPPALPATGSGLYAEYFSGTSFNRRILSRTDATVDFNWDSGTPDPALPADNFSVRWSGWLQIPADGSYTFTVRADDGVRLYIDGDLLIDEWQPQAATEYSATVSRLEAGRKVDLYLEYYEQTGAAVIQLSWSGHDFAKQIIPANRLYPRDVHSVHLDASYPKLVPGGWAVLSIPEYQELYEILSVSDDARALFTLSSKSTRLTLRGEQLRELFNERLRDTTVYAESDELQWAPRPLSGFLGGHVIDLTSLQPELAPKGWIAVSGLVITEQAANLKPRQRLARGDALAALEIARDRATATVSFRDGTRSVVTLEPRSEVVRIGRVMSENNHTRLELENDLSQAYLPATVRINANVAPASHGDSRQMRIQPEILGGGDSGIPFQRFTLLQKPLTFISAATPSGTASTLEIRVDGLRWQEAPRITAMTAKERGYLLRRGDDGTTTVQFGDGIHGARLPSGQTNVEARYRVGIGAEGNLDPGQISLLLTRPLGVKEVSNPVPASGGTGPEQLDQARRNAPLTVLTLDRIVSLRDFEDFATAFTGIGKAQAVWLWNGESRLVHLTISGLDGRDIDPASALYRNLAQAIDAARPPHQQLRLEPGRTFHFGLAAKIRVSPDYEAETVLAAAISALKLAFGFESRAYGQSLSGSELLAVLQAVAGVDWVDLDTLQAGDGTKQASAKGPNGRLRARRARWQEGALLPAELLLIDPAQVTLTEITP